MSKGGRGVSARYKIVRNGRGTTLEIGRGRYLSVGQDGKDVMIRGNGMVAAFPSWEDFVSAIDISQSSYYICDRPEKKKVGECVVDREGLILTLRRQYYRQGWIFKDWEAFYYEPGKPCYVPELSETVYTREDFLNLCKGQKDMAEDVFEAVDWQHPDVYLDEQYQSGKLAVCGFCGNIFRSGGADKCPYCGTERKGR